MLPPLLSAAVATAQRPTGNPEAAKVKNPVSASAESTAAGQKTFQRYCRGCHGADGKGGTEREGQPAPPNLTDDVWEHGSTDGEIFKVIAKGIAPDLFMEPYEDRLSDEEIWNVVNYLRSIGPKK